MRPMMGALMTSSALRHHSVSEGASWHCIRMHLSLGWLWIDASANRGSGDPPRLRATGAARTPLPRVFVCAAVLQKFPGLATLQFPDAPRPRNRANSCLRSVEPPPIIRALFEFYDPACAGLPHPADSLREERESQKLRALPSCRRVARFRENSIAYDRRKRTA
jgi:hypothetical protein